MNNIEISSAIPLQTFQNPDSRLADPNQQDVELFNAEYQSKPPSPQPFQANLNDLSSQPLSRTQMDGLAQAAAKGPEELAKATQEIITSDKTLAVAAAASATSLAPASATTFVEAAIQANPDAAAQIAASVAEVAIQANPSAAAQIASGIMVVAVKQNSTQASQIADSVSAVMMNAVPPISSSNTAGSAAGIMEAALKTNPAAASEMMRTPLSLNPQSAPFVDKGTQDVVSETVPGFSGISGQALAGFSNNPPTPTEAQIPSIVSAGPSQTFSTGFSALGGSVQGRNAMPVTPEAFVSKDTFTPPDQVMQFAAQAPANSVSTPTPAAQQAPKELSLNLLQLIASTVSKMDIGETQTTMTLQKTPELPGEVTIQVSIRNGNLEVSFLASDARALAMLQNNVAALQARLQQTLGATSVLILFPDGSSSDAAMDSTHAPTDSDRTGKIGLSDGRDGKDKVKGQSKSGGAQ